MTTGGGESVRESLTFRKYSAQLVTIIQDPEVLAWELYAEDVISQAVRDSAAYTMHEKGARTSSLLVAVESRIAVDPGVFGLFLSVLAKRPSMSDLCKKMKDACGKDTNPYNSVRQLSAVDIYASYLKSVYTREKLPIYDKWPKTKSKKYINLAFIEKDDITRKEADVFTRATIHGNIDDIKQSKRAMDIGQIAKLPDGSHPKCILVEGAPGVGKSTLAWKLCRKWGKGKLLQQYKLVVLLRLRDESVRAAKNISDMFHYHDHQVQQAAVEEIQRTGGKEVLLMFEGYDELPEEMRAANKSLFLNVITAKKLPEATVLVTSRPWASEFLQMECKSHISQHIEILGFTKVDIQSYLDSTTANDPSLLAGLKRYISCYPHMTSMMYIPLNTAIVVEVYRNSRKDETLIPKTMTELYSSLVRSLLLRHLLEHRVHGQKRIRSFNDLPPDIYQQLCRLGQIAYEGILHRQQVIFSDLPEDFETLGLMQCVPELYADEGAAVSYNFLHLTVQEYLAAFHLSQLPVEKQIEHYQKYRTGKDVQMNSHFGMVLQFLSGVRKFSGYPSVMLNAMCEKITCYTLRWLFEAQDSDVFAELLGSSDVNRGVLSSLSMSPFDCFMLGYCVSHSNCTWRIDLCGCHIGDKGVQMLVQGAVEVGAKCTGAISEMNLCCNDITSESVMHLLKFPMQLIHQLKTLALSQNQLNSKSCSTIARLIPHMPHLKVLDLSYNSSVGPGGAVSLIRLLVAHNSLEELYLHSTEIGVEDCQALSELLSSSSSVNTLGVGVNHLPPEAVGLIINGLDRNTTIHKLVTDDSHFSLQSTTMLSSVLETNHTLVFLNLRQCQIGSDGACQLASALSTNDTLVVVILTDNPIGIKGAAAFAEMLLKNKSLKVLNLQDDSIGDEGTQKLIDSLSHNTTLETLRLPKKYKESIATSSNGRV